MPINSFLYPGAKVTTGYDVANSLRFNDGSSDYLTKSFGTTQTSTAKFTVSVWVKRCTLGTRQSIFAAYDGTSAGGDDLEFETDDTLSYNGTGAGANTTSAKFRDPSAWLHIVLARDSSASGASNQVKIYVNGTLQTLSANNGCNSSQFLKSGLNSRIGTNQGASQYFVDMYMAELCVIDGQMLDATSFGEFDSDSPNIWKPIDVSGLTFGNNGFYLDFENASSLGADVSGNSNNFTVNNLTSVDQSTDTCTNNFATLNPLQHALGATVPALSEGNLRTTNTIANKLQTQYSNFAVSSGKWYCEIKMTSGSVFVAGISTLNSQQAEGQSGENQNYPGLWSEGWGYYYTNGGIYNSGSVIATYSTFTAGDIISIALDMENEKLYFAKNGTFQNSADPASGSNGIDISSIASNSDVVFGLAVEASSGGGTYGEFNFGSPPYAISSGNSDANGYGNFEYSVPSGYYSINTKNLAEFG